MALQQSIDDDSNQKILLQQITDYACGDSKLMINLINFIHPTWFLYGHGPLQSGSLIAKTTWDSQAQGANATVIPAETVFQVHHATCSRREKKV